MPTAQPKISIIIPTYNCDKVLASCLKSIIYQTYSNKEIIIIDGGSTDTTLKIIQSYEQYINYWISEADKGIYDAMNKGIDKSSGEWLYFLGSDDEIYDKYVLEDVFGKIEQTQTDVIYGDVLYKHNNIRYNGEFEPVKLYYANICHQSIFTRKTVFDKIGRFNIHYKVSADYDFNIRWFFKSTIRRKYVDKIIAVFSEKGYSSFGDNESFMKIKADLFKKNLSTLTQSFPIKVSVIIFNNNIQELTRLIKDILNQTFPFFELLLVTKNIDNEGKKIIDWYAQQDNRIKVKTQFQEQTWEDAINTSIAEAKSKWIWIVTPEVHPTARFLENLFPHAEGNAGAGLVMSAGRLYNHSALVGKFPIENVYAATGKWLHNTVINGEDVIKSIIIHYNPIVNISTVLIRQDLLNEAGGIQSNLFAHWDWLLYTKILLHAELIYIAAELSFVVYSQKTLDKKIGKATKIMSLAEYTHFISALLKTFESNNYMTSLLLKLFRKVWCDNASQGLIKLGHLKLVSQMLKPLDTKVKVSLYKNLLLINSNFSFVSQSVLKQLLEKNNSGLALKYDLKQSLDNAAKPYLMKLPEIAKERPRILHVIANFITGGSSRLVIDLIEHLGTEYEQEVVVPSLPYPPAYIGQVIRALSGYQAEEINKYIACFNPHIMHVHYWGKGDYKWYELFFRAAEKQQIPVVENINVPVQPYYSTSVKKYVYVSKFVQDEYALPGTKGVVIYPGSDFSLFNSDIHTSNNSCIGMVYRLDEDKLNENSIDVFIKVAQRKKDSHCLIVGGGHFYELYKNKVQRAGVESNFEFTGYVAYETLPDYFKRMSLFVAPVWDESFGQVSPFAMNMGLPVVGYNVGALSEIIDNPGLLITPGDSDSLADLIVELLLNNSMRYKIANLNKKRAQELFSVQAMIKGYKELYGYTLKQDAKLKAT